LFLGFWFRSVYLIFVLDLNQILILNCGCFWIFEFLGLLRCTATVCRLGFQMVWILLMTITIYFCKVALNLFILFFYKLLLVWIFLLFVNRYMIGILCFCKVVYIFLIRFSICFFYIKIIFWLIFKLIENWIRLFDWLINFWILN
jgi:hypothetical protein